MFRQLRSVAPAALVGIVLLGFAHAARSATDLPTTTEISQSPSYVYAGDQVTLTATVSPNPASGVVAFSYGGQVHAVVPVGSNGTASHVATAQSTGGGEMVVQAEFYNGIGYAGSSDFLVVDMRFLPNVVIPNPPGATQSDDPSISFDVGAGVTTECRLDGGSWKACTSPWTKSNLAEAFHTFEVHGTLGDGRFGPIAAATWAIDQTGPVAGSLELNDGIPSTNHGDVWLHHPATDALSGIAFVRVSRTGQLEPDGDLALVDNTSISYDRAWSQVTNQGHLWSVTLSESGPQTAWVQWFDAAGNGSTVASTSIDVRSGRPRIGGLWATTDPVVPFSMTGISGSEIASLRVVNGWGNLDFNLGNSTVFSTAPTSWDVGSAPADDGLPGRLRTVVTQWQDQYGQWSDIALVPIALLDVAMPDVAVDEGAGTTPDPVVQTNWAPLRALRYGVDVIQVEYSCNGTSWFGGASTGGYLPVYVDRAAAGCPSGNGARTLSFRWGHGFELGCCAWSDVRQVQVSLLRDLALPPNDEVGPTGGLGLANGSPATSTSTITLNAPATDATGVISVRLSNDGKTWTTRTYAPSQPWTLASGAGSRKVWAQWKDGARNWSEPITTTILVDATKPTVAGAGIGFAPGGTLTAAGSVPARVSWSGADSGGSGILRYDLMLSTDGGAFASIGAVTSASVTRSLAGGHSYRFRIRAVDRAGNVGAWLETVTVSRALVASGSFTYAGSWTRASCTSCLGGSQRTSRDAGAYARATVTGRAVAYVATVAPGQGSAKVYVDGHLVSTVSLAASSTAYRRIVWTTRWSTISTHTIRIVVVGPDGGPRVTLDGIAVLK